MSPARVVRSADVRQLLTDLDTQLGALGDRSTASIRRLRRTMSRSLRGASADLVLHLATALIARDGSADRFIAYELVAAHPDARATLGPARLRKLGQGMDSWSDVDMFGCYLAGPAWHAKLISNAEIARWTRSRDRWWRRAALVATVGLNARARAANQRGDRNTPDAERTLAVCRRLMADRDPMVVKAMSWALRELSKHSPAAVSRFVRENAAELPALVRREVNAKLTTGLKTPRRSRSAAKPG